MREILEDCSEITQGTIFSNAKSNDYNKDVYGILINGRCDIEHPQHYDTLLYLPIIPYDMWESKPAMKKILNHKYNDILNVLEGYRNFFSYEAVLYLPEHTEEIIDKYLKKEKEKNRAKNAIFFMTLYKKAELNVDFISSEEKAFKDVFFSDFEALKKRLIDNNLPDAYYLENVDFQDQSMQRIKRWVVLVTEIHSIPRKALKNLKNGIDLGRESYLRSFFGTDELVIPCATLKSPFIEHLIQKVESLFRVGVDRAEFFD